VAGRPRFFGLALIDIREYWFSLKASRGEASTSAPALTRTMKGLLSMTQADSVLSTPPTNTPEIRPTNIVRLNDRRALPPKKVKLKSQYELYPLQFFNGKKRCTWDVTPTGDYAADCEKGKAFAIEFLKSCDGTSGWASLMPSIVSDMIGTSSDGRWPDGGTKSNGLVIGFMGTVGSALASVMGRHAVRP
jgi:hypothetical protein